MKDAAYVEWVKAGRLVKALIWLVSSVSIITLLTAIAVSSPLIPFLFAVSASAAAFLLFLFWNYRGIQIKVTEKELQVRYGVFNNKRIPLKDIVSCEPVKISFRKYGGVGIRYGIDGSWAYATSLGDAVKINLRKGKPFVFSSNNPEKICNIIKKTRDSSQN